MNIGKVRIWVACFLTVWLSAYTADPRPQIRVLIRPDTTLWAPQAYLSMIPDFTQMYTISKESIIQQAELDPDGSFIFDCGSLPEDDHLYRIHIPKKGDPPASLIIGGRDENHLFLIASRQSEMDIRTEGGVNLLSWLKYSGYPHNRALQEINQIAGFLDTLDFYGPAVNRDFVREAVYERLRSYADTCTHPLISLYALYHSRFESDYSRNPEYYKRYLRKWRNEDSDYFKAFRAQLPQRKPGRTLLPVLLITGILLVSASLFIYFKLKKKPDNNHYQLLTVQERKIFGLLKEGRSNKEISEICAISLSTVKSHVNSIYAKLKLGSRTEVMDYTEFER